MWIHLYPKLAYRREVWHGRYNPHLGKIWLGFSLNEEYWVKAELYIHREADQYIPGHVFDVIVESIITWSSTGFDWRAGFRQAIIDGELFRADGLKYCSAPPEFSSLWAERIARKLLRNSGETRYVTISVDAEEASNYVEELLA